MVARMQHVFIDVEAFGPPGVGRPFALGAAKFDMARGVYERTQWLIRAPGSVGGDQSTMEWLSQQSPRVLAQMRGGLPFGQAWGEFLCFADADDRARNTVFWADDWSDFAWLDFEARDYRFRPLRDFGSQYDSSAIVALADPLKVYSVEKYGEFVPHIAMDDATAGALDLIASLKILGRDLP